MNRILIGLWAVALSGCAIDVTPKDTRPTMQELEDRYQKEWSSQVRALAGTATGEAYLTAEEQTTFYYLNLARLNPALFASTYATGYEGPVGYSNGKNFDTYKGSLVTKLQGMSPLSTLKPSRAMYDLAHCHAVGIGAKGAVTHDRSVSGCPAGYSAECCSFGMHNGFDIAMQLLVDDDVPSLGHRAACLGTYQALGISSQPHTVHDRCAVLDFN